jgi:ethanolamine utilization protein EutQ (cupin superfamily)
MEMVLKKAADIHTEPLEDIGEGKLNIVDVVAQPEGAPYSGGICEIWHAAPIVFEYDHDGSVCYMIEGEIELEEDGVKKSFEPGDVVYIPKKEGLKVAFHTPSWGKFFFVSYPPWR